MEQQFRSVTLHYPASREAIQSWYQDERNKRTIYIISLLLWLSVMIMMITVLSLTASNLYRIAFYLPMLFFIPALGISTHWMLVCFYEERAARYSSLQKQQQQQQTNETVFEVRDEHIQ